ncbi:hypothetical protein BU15DRAFT_80961 [Melanogaster broomeanus]|nr:hypothetical protein BU15DRAFT_80961 [Melanogaster broomeanus]
MPLVQSDDPDVPVSMSSALRTLGTLSQTVGRGIYQERGLGPRRASFSCPLIPEHRASIQAHTMASVNTTQATSYAPYTRFPARRLVGGTSSSAQTPNNNEDGSQRAGAHLTLHTPSTSLPPLSPGSACSRVEGSTGCGGAEPRPLSRGRTRDQDTVGSRSHNSRSISPLQQRSSHFTASSRRRSRSRDNILPPLDRVPGKHLTDDLTDAINEPFTHPVPPLSISLSPGVVHISPSQNGIQMEEDQIPAHRTGTDPRIPLDVGVLMDADPESHDQTTAAFRWTANPESHDQTTAGCPSSTSITSIGGSNSSLDTGVPMDANPESHDQTTAGCPSSTSITSIGGSNSSLDAGVSMDATPISPHQTITQKIEQPCPLPLPTSLECVIDRVVTQLLNAVTSELVEPTIQGIVDACDPRLTGLIKSQLAMLDPFPPARKIHQGRKNLSEPSADPEADADGDDDEGSPIVMRRQKPGPRGKGNRLHEAFRIYLRAMNIIPSGPKGALPGSASWDAVRSFNNNGISPPSLPNISLDWSCSPLTSSRWNTEAIALLSLNFYEKLKEGYKDVTFDEKTMSLPKLRKLCEQKLVRTYRAHCKHTKLNSCTIDERAEVIAKEERRMKIAEQNRSRDPAKWDTIRTIIECLDLEGMSGDETDSTSGVKPKVVRRVELPWISSAISTLFNSVESYESALREENMLEKIGNSSLERHFEARRKNGKATAVPGLPRNWYNDNWFQGLTHGAHSMLSACKDVPVPTLEQFKKSR